MNEFNRKKDTSEFRNLVDTIYHVGLWVFIVAGLWWFLKAWLQLKGINKMLAFNNDPKLKEFYVNRMNEHSKADDIIQGTGWENGKGCFIGCTLHAYSHKKFESEGIGPEWLAKLADKLFEGMEARDAKKFAVNFYSSMKVGLDLKKVKRDFFIYIMEENLKVLNNCDYGRENWSDEYYKNPSEGAARNAKSAAWGVVYKKYADKLLELLSGS